MKSSKQGKPKPKYSGDKATTKQGKCQYCGQTHKARQCPAYGRICNLCGRKNHFAFVCLQIKPVDMLTETALHTGVIDDVTLAEVKPNEWFETVGVEGRKVKVDTGASYNVMSMNTYQALASDRLVKAKTRLESYGGHRKEGRNLFI